MGKNGKLRKKNKQRGNYRVHIKVYNGSKVFKYHIFIFEGETIACVEEFTKDNYDYAFIKSRMNVLDYANTIKSKPGVKENISDDDIELSISKLKCRIVSDLKYMDSVVINKYLHYIYEVLSCDKRTINV